ncbi:MAG: hypothetical protein LBK59_02785 [Bifidobacteriaceae bacterium]|jgi:hypothetical protein|nr:hypothetical protein [Bifidobacteriaceae bacterium]
MDSDSPDTPLPPAADTEVIAIVPDLPAPDEPVAAEHASGASGSGESDSTGTHGWRPVVPAEPDEPSAIPADRQASRKATREAAKSKRKIWVSVAGVVVVAAVLTVVVVMVARGRTAPPVPPPEPVVVSVTVAPPSPTISPVALPAETAFARAMPLTVGEFALSEANAYPEWSADGAIEAYRLVYSDGVTEVPVIAGQWPTPEAAAAARSSGLASDGATPSEPGVTWANETAVIAVGGPVDLAQRFADLFPM